MRCDIEEIEVCVRQASVNCVIISIVICARVLRCKNQISARETQVQKVLSEGEKSRFPTLQIQTFFRGASPRIPPSGSWLRHSILSPQTFTSSYAPVTSRSFIVGSGNGERNRDRATCVTGM